MLKAVDKQFTWLAGEGGGGYRWSAIAARSLGTAWRIKMNTRTKLVPYFGISEKAMIRGCQEVRMNSLSVVDKNWEK